MHVRATDLLRQRRLIEASPALLNDFFGQRQLFNVLVGEHLEGCDEWAAIHLHLTKRRASFAPGHKKLAADLILGPVQQTLDVFTQIRHHDCVRIARVARNGDNRSDVEAILSIHRRDVGAQART